MVKLIGPKNDPPAALQEKVLSLIQTWADAFRNQPDLQGVYQIYAELKNKGIEFPAQDLDSMAPIHTPQRTMSGSAGSQQNQPPQYQQHSTQQHHTSSHPIQQQIHPHPVAAVVPVASSGPISLDPEQTQKLKGELEIVNGNIKIFEEMMAEMSPSKDHHPEDWELLRELNTTCRSMQKRLVPLIEKVQDEEITIELLRLNDELNNLFVRYDRFVKKKSNNCVDEATVGDHLPQVERKKVQQLPDDSLIDLADLDLNLGASASAVNSSQASSKPRPDSDDFDMFAQSRSATYERNKTTGSSYADQKLDLVDSSLGALSQNRSQIPSKREPLPVSPVIIDVPKLMTWFV